MTKTLLSLALLLAAVPAFAQDTVDFAQPDGTAARVQVTTTNDLRVADIAATEALEFNWCPGTAVTTMTSAQYVADAKALYCENRSSATIYASLDAVNVTTDGASGWKFAPGTERVFAIEGDVFGPNIKAAATAATTSPSCLWCSWLK